MCVRVEGVWKIESSGGLGYGWLTPNSWEVDKGEKVQFISLLHSKILILLFSLFDFKLINFTVYILIRYIY